MSEGVVYLIASIIVVVAWGFNTAFIYRYARYSDWEYSLVGRTQMQGRASMWLLLTYALTVRWLDVFPPLQYVIGLIVYTLIALMEVRMYFVLRYTQLERVSLQVHNYTPIRNWWKNLRSKKEN